MTAEDGYHRFVPQGKASLTEDAPGWGNNDTNQDCPLPDRQAQGPVCWKCRGSGSLKHKKRKADGRVLSKCSVCHGQGRLPPKQAETAAAIRPGVITRGRRRPVGWTASGPIPYALGGSSESDWTNMARLANEQKTDVSCNVSDQAPDWIPRRGEELCNLVGSWRILQRVGSHRWTTDDLVTAYVAAREASSCLRSSSRLNYLDLGTGNASVLQMVTWALLKDQRYVHATGVEARSEAVQMARRSLTFNLGQSERANICVAHGDFRNFMLDNQPRFDLVTGTPPYFRVDFSVSPDDSYVTSAVIKQGGMPTARQSAPARCEFRGGIEAYCEVAARVLHRDGLFVVCENWLNHERVMAAAKQSKLQILRQTQVRGRERRHILFCVYTMAHLVIGDDANDAAIDTTLTVRDNQGNWTQEYTDTVLETMSIPNPFRAYTVG